MAENKELIVYGQWYIRTITLLSFLLEKSKADDDCLFFLEKQRADTGLHYTGHFA